MPTHNGSFSFFLILLVGCGVIASTFTTANGQLAAGAAILAIEEKAAAAGGQVSSPGGVRGKNSGATASKSSAAASKKNTKTAVKRAPTPPKPTKYDGPVIGDKYSFLNFEIAQKVQPIWTIKAKDAGAIGLVQVEVSIDENGNVLSARPRTGNALLHPEAERAALATRFNKPSVNGQPARAMGFIVYRFGTEEQEYEQQRKAKNKAE